MIVPGAASVNARPALLFTSTGTGRDVDVSAIPLARKRTSVVVLMTVPAGVLAKTGAQKSDSSAIKSGNSSAGRIFLRVCFLIGLLKIGGGRPYPV